MSAEILAPALGPRPLVLILGLAPGRLSLRRGQYYAEPRDQFWRLAGAALGRELEGLPYAERLAFAQSRGLALWTIYPGRPRQAAQAADFEEPEPNAVPRLLRETGIRAVFCNGGAAWAAYQRHCAEAVPGGVEAFRLPSSAPTAGLPFEEKLPAWSRLAERLGR
ncbi:MAG: DNA-deoxyinosine glycosylase [Elusimicrobia bacterium]|nr:DNA-deoxyinosine glycosylase [Elusimicrobiota bacterium]MDE2236526.1 DNA-deoxyinosine glycosylase [Elusimicrobiota bacterium]MDE2426424.1 DNA-deoxyinosine glycosylase [Elusimicrobiota bacterium]